MLQLSLKLNVFPSNSITVAVASTRTRGIAFRSWVRPVGRRERTGGTEEGSEVHDVSIVCLSFLFTTFLLLIKRGKYLLTFPSCPVSVKGESLIFKCTGTALSGNIKQIL